MKHHTQPLIRFIRCWSGASAVEFAIVFPIFLMALFGILVFGGHLAIVHGVQQLAAEAARTSIAGLDGAERSRLAKGYVTANAMSYPLIDPARLRVDAAASPGNADVYVVTVTYDSSDSFIHALPQFVPAPPATIVRAAAIPRGGY